MRLDWMTIPVIVLIVAVMYEYVLPLLDVSGNVKAAAVLGAAFVGTRPLAYVVCWCLWPGLMREAGNNGWVSRN